MFLLLSLPITLTSLLLYLFLTLLGNSTWVWWSAFVISISLLYFVCRNYFKNNPDFKKILSKKNLVLISLILLFVFAKAFVISPFALIKTTGSFQHIQITDVGDYYKHTFVVTMLKLDGIPPHHPYFPIAKLSYYYGYYLLPATFSRLFNLPPNQVFYAFSIITDLLGLLIILRIFNRVLKTFFGKVLAVLLLITGVGVNVLPEILDKYPKFGLKINPNIFSTETGFQLINNYKALLFVPQHFFAACLAIGLIYYLLFEKPKILSVSISAAFIFLSSIFVSWTLVIWLFLVFIFKKEKRIFLVLAGVISLGLLAPYIISFSDRENIFKFNNFSPFQFISGNGPATFVNTLLTAFLQYGLIICILPFAIILKGRNFLRKNFILILGLMLPFAATWLLRSPFFNDLSLRSLMPIQLILPAIFIKLSEGSKKYFKIFLIAVAVLTIMFGSLAFYLEYSRHWKARFILDPKVSKFIFEVRKIPDSVRLSAIDRDRWVEFIPSLGFKKVLSPYLFDSYVYFVGKLTAEHGQYERLALDLFIDPNIGKDTKALVLARNLQFARVFEFFNKYQADLLILNNQLWVKKDINPWLAVVSAMGVKERPLTGDYTLVDYPSLLGKTSQNQILIEEDKGIILPVVDKKFPLKSGLWYLVACSNKKQQLHFELEDYYLLFNQEVDGNNKACVGKMFYLQKDDNIMLTRDSNIENVFAFPIAIIGTK